MARLNDKVVLVTGCTSEIAIACIRSALAEGAAAVVMTGINDPKGMDLAGLFGDKCAYRRLDVTQEKDWKNVIDFIRGKYGRLNVLVNNAGITGTKTDPPATSLAETSLASWQKVVQTDLDSVFLGCREAIPLMKDSGPSAIVNIGSRSGLVARPDRLAYGAAKAALINLTKSIAVHCAEHGYNIRCNAVLPSCILTSMWEPVLGTKEQFNTSLYEKIAGRIPLKRFGAPEEVAAAVLFLASDESSYITGTEIVIDGGAQAKDALRG